MYRSPDDGEENAMKTNEGPIGKPSLTPWPGQEAQPSRAKPLLGEEEGRTFKKIGLINCIHRRVPQT